MGARKYSENYLQFGFIFTEDPDFPRPLSSVWKKLLNQVTVHSKLKRHLEGKHESVAYKNKFFLRWKAQRAKQSNFIKYFITVSTKLRR